MRQDLIERRKLSYLINSWDDIGLESFEDYNNIPNQVIEFFKTESKLIYPAKSYFVAIVYSMCLQKYFGVDFYQSLDDRELLPDDKYFVPYSQDKDSYNYILDRITNIWEYSSIYKTLEYFKKEFLIDDIDN